MRDLEEPEFFDRSSWLDASKTIEKNYLGQ
jgi:hypothetical protein